MSIIAKIGIFGDTHANSDNYGGHSNYPSEFIEYFTKISDIAEQQQLTHLIGTGDLTFGKFNKLEFRVIFERELERQIKATNGNRYELCGNHDSATNGMTEYEYYTARGMLKKSANISVGNLNITMLDYKKDGNYTLEDMNIVNDGYHKNLVIAHQYFKFNNSNIPNFGEAIILDNNEAMFGADKLICGHVHHIINFSGDITLNGVSKNCDVQYLGCMMRPAYRAGMMDNVGNMAIVTVHDDGRVEFDTLEIELWPIDKSFNIAKISEEKQKKEEKVNRVDISDIVKQLDSHDRNIGDPEDIIRGMSGIDDKYKNKAISLLHNALN